MDINEFRALKESGGTVADAALQEEEVLEEEQEEVDEEQQEEEETDEREEEAQEEEDDLPPLPPKEQTAFEKRMAREKAKLEEKLRQEIEAATESKYSKHREAIELLGGDPEKLLKAAAESKVLKEAQKLADQNGWTEEETKWYVEQKKQEAELKELRVQMQINRLRDNPEYAGISSMEREILQKIDKSNGALSVEEAYWALGGSKKAEQIKLEAQQREIAKRAKTPRTVVKDSPSNTTREKPIPESVLREAKLMGISEAEARRLMNSKASSDIDSWREERRKAKGG